MMGQSWGTFSTSPGPPKETKKMYLTDIFPRAYPPNPPDFKLDEAVYQVDGPSIFDEKPAIDELNSLTVNITLPCNEGNKSPLPVFVYIHGGSFLFGGATHPYFSGINFVSTSMEIGQPVIHVNFTYRTGLGGFLASKDIEQDLEKDGFAGAGNFGLTDQKLAFDWIQTYINHFGGDRDNVTATGESAGSISIGNHFAASDPPIYHRASMMSGMGPTIPTWSLEHHEKLYQAVLRYLNIKPGEGALDKLRARSQYDISLATTQVNGVIAGTGNPCDDGWYHSKIPSMGSFESPPPWIKSLMIGDCLHEGIIFRWNIASDTFDTFFKSLADSVGENKAKSILDLYNIGPDTDANEARLLMEELLGDVYFKIPAWLTLRASKLPQTFGYHFDQLSEIDGPAKGTAYHCHGLLYLFMNNQKALKPDKLVLARTIAGAWINFTYGRYPWAAYGQDHMWMIFGPNDTASVKKEEEDEEVRRYRRFLAILDLDCWVPLAAAIDEIGSKRLRMGRNE
ncbi:hypothetical protein NW765_017664 [Fusarium oxysporum]|nr:hypothetical protein NW765_017664 [Fusarium oxysporum]KAJ4257610.1 hypothetical protein NW764_016300 [Fusarium oxysporum]